MKILETRGKKIKDSRGDFTIEVKIKTDVGSFSASAPNGKSKGKHEAKSYKKTIEDDMETLKKFSDYFSEEHIEKFDDLRRVEDVIARNIGANTLFALESAVLKAMASEQKKEIWELIDPKARGMPRLVGNCVGGGAHSSGIDGRKPDFQEFLLIPNTKTVKEAFELNKKIREDVAVDFKRIEKGFKKKSSDEKGWLTGLNEKEILDVLNKKKIDLGLDVAASNFFKRKKYHYENPKLDRVAEEQVMYLANLMKNFNLIYVEDPFGEEDFESFGKLLKLFKGKMIVGDDLTVTNYKRVEKAIQMKSMNAMIIKPNQNGSLMEVKRVVELCKKKDIKMIFSHRSGETMESILADLAFGFGAEFIKCGITGDVREVKIKRLIEIEEGLK